MDVIKQLFPNEYINTLQTLDLHHIEEIRMSVGQPLSIRIDGRERQIYPRIAVGQLEAILQTACGQSVYAHAETIRQGYVALAGGHRLGICGSGVVRDRVIQTIRAPTSLVLRIAHAVPGCAEKLLPHIKESTLLLGPPGSGKTTLLRDLVRLLSDQRGQRISLADERGELSGYSFGQHHLSVGSRTDVMLQIPKDQAVMMMLRTMNPQWIALDEITAPEDIHAMETASYCGVHLLATAHGSSAEDLHSRPLYQRLMDLKLFSSVVLLHSNKSYELLEV